MNRPQMIRQPTGHGRCLLLPTGPMGLVKVGLAQRMMAGAEIIKGPQQKHGCVQSLLALGGVPTATGQNRQAFAKGGVEPFNVSSVDEQAPLGVDQLLHHKRWRAAQNALGQAKDRCAALSGLFDDTGDGERFPALQLATSPLAVARHLVPKGPQNGIRIGGPAICNDEQGASTAGTTADASQQAVGQGAITARTDDSSQPEASADHHRHPKPQQDATAFDPNFVGLHMRQFQFSLFNDGLMHLFAVRVPFGRGTITPVCHGPFIQAIGLDNGLHGTTRSQQRDDDYDQRPVTPQPGKHGPLLGAEAFSTALALIPQPLAPVTHDIPGIALPACFTPRIGAKYALSVLGFSFCHHKQSLHQERFFPKFALLYHLVG